MVMVMVPRPCPIWIYSSQKLRKRAFSVILAALFVAEAGICTVDHFLTGGIFISNMKHSKSILLAVRGKPNQCASSYVYSAALHYQNRSARQITAKVN